MNRIWQLQEAKNKLSEVVDEAMQNGPQLITRRGIETVVVISFADYRKMVAKQEKLTAFFRESPLVDAELDLLRDAGGRIPRYEFFGQVEEQGETHSQSRLTYICAKPVRIEYRYHGRYQGAPGMSRRRRFCSKTHRRSEQPYPSAKSSHLLVP
jgi:antitoxin Phd